MKKLFALVCIVMSICFIGCINKNKESKEEEQLVVREKLTRDKTSTEWIEKYEIGRGFNSTEGLSCGLALERKEEDVSMTSYLKGNSYKLYEATNTEELKKSLMESMYVGVNYKSMKNEFNATVQGSICNSFDSKNYDYTAVVEYQYSHKDYTLGSVKYINEDIKKQLYSNEGLFIQNYGDSYLKSVRVGIRAYALVKITNNSTYSKDSSEWKVACKIKMNSLFGGKLNIDVSGSTNKSEEIAKTGCSVMIETYDNANQKLIISDPNVESIKNYIANVEARYDEEKDYEVITRAYSQYKYQPSIDTQLMLKRWIELRKGILVLHNTPNLNISNEDWKKIIEYINIINENIFDIYSGKLPSSESQNPSEIDNLINKYIKLKTIRVMGIVSEDGRMVSLGGVVLQGGEEDETVSISENGYYVFNYLKNGNYTIYSRMQPNKKQKITVNGSKQIIEIYIKFKTNKEYKDVLFKYALDKAKQYFLSGN